jgi:hypothetical protein
MGPNQPKGTDEKNDLECFQQSHRAEGHLTRNRRCRDKPMLGPTWHLVDRFWSSLSLPPLSILAALSEALILAVPHADLFGCCDKENGGITVS